MLREPRVPRKTKRLLTPFALGAFSLVLGWFHVGALSFWDDEAYSYFAAHLSWSGLWNLSTTVDPHTTLWHIILKLWYGVHDGQETWGRLPSVAAGAATVVAVWGLCRRLFDERIALIAGVLLAVSTTMISYQSEARPYTLATFFTALAVWRMVVAIRDPSTRNAWLYGATVAFAMYAHPFTALVAAVLAPVFVFAIRRSMSSTRLSVPAAVAFIVCGLPEFVLIGVNQDKDNLSWIPSFSPSLVIDCVSFLTGNRNPLILLGEVVVFAFGIVGLVRRKPTERWPYVLVAAWLAGAPLLALAIDIAKPVIVARYLIPTMPAFSIALAVAIDACSTRRFVRETIAVAAITALFVSGIIGGRTHYRIDNDWRTAVRTVMANAKPGDRVLTFHHEPVFRYYAVRDAEWSLQYVERGKRPHETDMLRQANDFSPETNLASELAAAGRIWVVQLVGSLDDPSQADYLSPDLPYASQDFGHFHGVNVRLLTPS